MDEKYDSRYDTLQHIGGVDRLMSEMVEHLNLRRVRHDESKLGNIEKPVFDVVTPRLKRMTYGSEGYKASLTEMKAALDHHYANNRHHPEHFDNGIEDMTLIDLCEMLADWKAATDRHADGDIAKSLEINKERFNIPPALQKVLENTVAYLGYTGGDNAD